MKVPSRLDHTLKLPNTILSRPMKDGKCLRPDNNPTIWTPAVPSWFQALDYLAMIIFQ